MKILLLATTRRKAGATFHARKLADHLGAQVASADESLDRLVRDVWSTDADVVQIEVEYATLGSVARTLLFLPLIVAIRRLRGPVVLTFHGVVTRDGVRDFPLPRLVGAAFRISYALLALFASAVTVHSEAMRDALAAECGVRDAVVIPHGADRPPAVPRRPQRHHLVFFGFVRPSKGLEGLIEAIGLLRATYPDVRLTIAGGLALERERDHLGSLRTAAQGVGGAEHIVFATGFLGEEEKWAILSSAEVLVLPYTDWYVEVSGVVHDFMAYGVPLIVSDRPRFSELTDGLDCLKVQPEPRAIARAVQTLFEDSALAERLAAQLQKESDVLSWDRIAERHRRLYEDVVRGRVATI